MPSDRDVRGDSKLKPCCATTASSDCAVAPADVHAEIFALADALQILGVDDREYDAGPAINNAANVEEARFNIPCAETRQVDLGKASGYSAGNEHASCVLDSPDLQGIAKLILEGRVKRCIAMVGAGISVSAGIPDFRTPGTGLYDNLHQYGLPEPEDVFDIQFFRQNPKPFCRLAKELLPGTYIPTPTHMFLTLLHKKGLLQRCFTQNIDSLEVSAGLPKEVVVAAHGNFDTASCIDCSAPAVLSEVFDCISQEKISRCKHCRGLVKPDIVFFGESLPERFFSHCSEDLHRADLAIVMGTSLSVAPFSSLPELVPSDCPRLLINREIVGDFDFHSEHVRDAVFKGECDDGIMELVRLLGWTAEFQDHFNTTIKEAQSECNSATSQINQHRQAPQCTDQQLQDTRSCK
eukprot:jgi/Ulvmu1/3549/UM166_0003.1